MYKCFCVIDYINILLHDSSWKSYMPVQWLNMNIFAVYLLFTWSNFAQPGILNNEIIAIQ